MWASNILSALNSPAARVPQAPFSPWTEIAPTGSSTPIRSITRTATTTKTPAIAPVRTAKAGVRLAQPAVIATRPARVPLRVMPTSGFPNFTHAVIIAKTAPAAAARLVFTAIRAVEVLAAVVEPGLKPNQPNQRMKTPSVARGMLWPGIAVGLPSFVYLPRRGPRQMAPARAAHPPIEWTTVEPAKSMKPSPSSHPFALPWKSDPQAHDPKMG